MVVPPSSDHVTLQIMFILFQRKAEQLSKRRQIQLINLHLFKEPMDAKRKMVPADKSHLKKLR